MAAAESVVMGRTWVAWRSAGPGSARRRTGIRMHVDGDGKVIRWGLPGGGHGLCAQEAEARKHHPMPPEPVIASGATRAVGTPGPASTRRGTTALPCVQDVRQCAAFGHP